VSGSVVSSGLFGSLLDATVVLGAGVETGRISGGTSGTSDAERPLPQRHGGPGHERSSQPDEQQARDGAAMRERERERIYERRIRP
jgi:hypothetical protein